MHSGRIKETRRQRWRDLKEMGEFVGAVLLLLAVVVGGIMLPGFLTDSASTVGARMTQAARR
jgi:uncharacterized iron-regulated membrane protein